MDVRLALFSNFLKVMTSRCFEWKFPVVWLQKTTFVKEVTIVDVTTTRIAGMITKKKFFTSKQSLKESSIGKATDPVMKFIVI